MRSNGVTVSTLDFESSDGGSNPPWTFLSVDWRKNIDVMDGNVVFLSRSYSSVGQSVRLITVRSAVQARVGAFYIASRHTRNPFLACLPGHRTF